ncbi:DgyrCDS13850 [Dimorphilus gyrociliatus]|uniref:DgyrCDS13850 n=1 Tax=Dimorphilus gyrociliatus TaxID=2664684 RepID=A0A7I8WC33_9ANNE|nr:DgyrCDS13850 [Dimorphilus gyrociliatus]
MAPLAMAQIAENLATNQNSYRRVGEQIERSALHAVSSGVISSSGTLAVCASICRVLPRAAIVSVPIGVGVATSLTVYNKLVKAALSTVKTRK